MAKATALAFGAEKARNPAMSPSVHKENRATVQQLREKAEAALSASELAKESDKVSALLPFNEAIQELGDA